MCLLDPHRTLRGLAVRASLELRVCLEPQIEQNQAQLCPLEDLYTGVR